MLRKTRNTFILVALALLSGMVYAQESNYQRLLVANRVSIEIPKHWQGLDIDQRRNLAAASDALDSSSQSRLPPGHVAALAVNATPSPPGAIVRVSMIQTEPITQGDLRQALLEDRAGTIEKLRSVFHQELTGLATELQKIGIRILGTETVEVTSIGGQIAVAVSYRRISLTGPSPFQVTQYHVPLGSEKALITLSYREADASVYSLIIDYVKTSISIK